MSFFDPFLSPPGMGSPILSVENEFTWGPLASWQIIGIVLDSTAVDGGSTPNTILRRGIALGQVAATGKFKQYSATATDGSQFGVGFLYQSRNMLDPRSGTAADQLAQAVIFGNIKVNNVFGLDENFRRQTQGRFIFDDYRQDLGGYRQVIAKTANYTVVAADNDVLFTTTGAAGSVNFTLPATPVKGFSVSFMNTVNQTMTVTAPAGKLIALNNAAATSVSFATANQKIGGGVEIVVDDTGTFYIAIPLNWNGQTVTVA